MAMDPSFHKSTWSSPLQQLVPRRKSRRQREDKVVRAVGENTEEGTGEKKEGKEKKKERNGEGS